MEHSYSINTEDGNAEHSSLLRARSSRWADIKAAAETALAAFNAALNAALVDPPEPPESPGTCPGECPTVVVDFPFETVMRLTPCNPNPYPIPSQAVMVTTANPTQGFFWPDKTRPSGAMDPNAIQVDHGPVPGGYESGFTNVQPTTWNSVGNNCSAAPAFDVSLKEGGHTHVVNLRANLGNGWVNLKVNQTDTTNSTPSFFSSSFQEALSQIGERLSRVGTWQENLTKGSISFGTGVGIRLVEQGLVKCGLSKDIAKLTVGGVSGIVSTVMALHSGNIVSAALTSAALALTAVSVTCKMKLAPDASKWDKCAKYSNTIIGYTNIAFRLAAIGVNATYAGALLTGVGLAAGAAGYLLTHYGIQARENKIRHGSYCPGKAAVSAGLTASNLVPSA